MSQMTSAVAAIERPTVEVKSLENISCESWNDYVGQHPEGTFFHLAEWREVLHRAFGHPSYYLYAVEGNAIRGILPLAHVKSLFFGNALISTPR